MRQDSEETLTDKEQTTHQNQPYIQSCKAQSISKLSQNERFQEIISNSSDSEKETKSQPKKRDKELWKFRNPKKSSKYVPEIREDVEYKGNGKWLSKRYPSEFEKNANTIKSFRDDMMSNYKDTYRLEKE